jgi:hypothetical protein
MLLALRFGTAALKPHVIGKSRLARSRQSYAERDPGLIALAKEIKTRGGRVSLREVAAELEARGYLTPRESATARRRWLRCWREPAAAGIESLDVGCPTGLLIMLQSACVD